MMIWLVITIPIIDYELHLIDCLFFIQKLVFTSPIVVQHIAHYCSECQKSAAKLDNIFSLKNIFDAKYKLNKPKYSI